MENVIIYILFLIFGILQLILFFKIWGMTNNVARIKDDVDIMSYRAKRQYAKEHENETNNDISSYPDWVIGSVVVRIPSGEQMKIISLNSNGSFL